MTTLIRLLLAALFFLCLAPMPYGYYAFVRFAAMVGFGWLAYNAKQEGQVMLPWVYLCLALLFQPFIKIALGRTIWNVVDVVLGVWLVAAALWAKNK
ncbi:MAG: hypothetical protein JSS77_01395 [Acidobacteria bacterium]|nr:hypothetical protein [Acidobacteriota bacterium]